MHDPISPLEKNQTFHFTCSPQVPCFNACCRDLNQALTPYDVLCLKHYLGISSGDFLQSFTQESTGPETGFPVVSLRFSDSDELACPFVADVGCRVYPARPASCRTYPLARGVSCNRKTGKRAEQWALIREPHCLGFREGKLRTVSEWVADQQIADHNRMNDRMLELISLKNRLLPGPLPPAVVKKVSRVLYDLDAFRMDLFSVKNDSTISLDAQTMERARSNDQDLLIAAMKWVGMFLSDLASEKRGR